MISAILIGLWSAVSTRSAQRLRPGPGRAGPRRPSASGPRGAQAPRGTAGLCPYRAGRSAPAPPPARPAPDRRRRPAAARTAARRVTLGLELTATSRPGPGQTRIHGLGGAGGCVRGPGRQQRAAWRPAGRSSAGAETWAEFERGAWGRVERRCPRAPLPAGPGMERAEPGPRRCGSRLPPASG